MGRVESHRGLVRRWQWNCVLSFSSTFFPYLTPAAILPKGFRSERSESNRRELGVMFKDLRVVGVGPTVSYQPTFGSIFNPKIMLENIRSARNPQFRDIISGFDGVVLPGEMLRKEIH